MRVLLLGIAPIVVCFPFFSQAQTTHDKALAKKRYEVGEQLYEVSQYSKALTEFEEAYRLYPLPALLFNIARCHELTGKPEQAIQYYKQYLDKDPGSPKRSVIEARIKSIQERLDSRPPEKPAQGAPQDPDKPKPEPVDTPVEGTWRKIAGWTAVGVGGAVLVTGVVFGALASKKSKEHDDATAEGTVYEEMIEIQRAGERYEKAQIGLLVVGGVVLAAGGGLLLWDRLGRRKETASSGGKALLVPVVGDNTVGVAGCFEF